MSRLKQSAALVAGLITIGIVIGIVLTTNFNLDSKSVASSSPGKIYTESDQQWDENQTRPTAGNFDPNAMFVDVINKVRPSIVSIYTTKKVKVPANPFFRFFREFENMPDDEFHRREIPQPGLGSGIIINKDGYILTNNHVIEDVDELKVKMLDGSEYDAEVVGSDPTTDIGLIKIDAEDLPVSVLGNSDNVQIGEWVMAIGSPLNLTSTVTAGIVSALGRQVNIIQDQEGRGIEDFIQTDAAINPGNSGGALVNLKGEVIGVNTAIATRTNYYMGYGFAIPINIAKSVVEDLTEYGEVRRGYLGVYIAEVDQVTAKGVKLDKPRGVFITSVVKGSAAEKAGMKEGDVVLEVNGKKVNKPNELQAIVGSHDPGERVDLVIWRNAEEKEMTVELGSQSGASDSESSRQQKERSELADLGMEIRNLRPQEKEKLESDYGVLVEGVKRMSAAADANIARGDVILQVNGESVQNVDDFYDKIQNYEPGSVVRLKLRRLQNGELFDRLLFLEIPKKK